MLFRGVAQAATCSNQIFYRVSTKVMQDFVTIHSRVSVDPLVIWEAWQLLCAVSVRGSVFFWGDGLNPSSTSWRGLMIVYSLSSSGECGDDLSVSVKRGGFFMDTY